MISLESQSIKNILKDLPRENYFGRTILFHHSRKLHIFLRFIINYSNVSHTFREFENAENSIANSNKTRFADTRERASSGRLRHGAAKRKEVKARGNNENRPKRVVKRRACAARGSKTDGAPLHIRNMFARWSLRRR